MERPKIATTGSAAAAAASAAAADKRKKSEEASASKESRIDARQVIDDLIKSANLEHDENAEGTRPYSTIFSQHVWQLQTAVSLAIDLKKKWARVFTFFLCLLFFLQCLAFSWKTSQKAARRRTNGSTAEAGETAKSMAAFGDGVPSSILNFIFVTY